MRLYSHSPTVEIFDGQRYVLEAEYEDLLYDYENDEDPYQEGYQQALEDECHDLRQVQQVLEEFDNTFEDLYHRQHDNKYPARYCYDPLCRAYEEMRSQI